MKTGCSFYVSSSGGQKTVGSLGERIPNITQSAIIPAPGSFKGSRESGFSKVGQSVTYFYCRLQSGTGYSVLKKYYCDNEEEAKGWEAIPMCGILGLAVGIKEKCKDGIDYQRE